MDIFKLSPAGKDYLWGGTRLKNVYGKKMLLTEALLSVLDSRLLAGRTEQKC